MKISGARAEPFSAIRRRALVEAGGQAAAPAAPGATTFLGLAEADLTPAVRAALNTLIGEMDELRLEVARLKLRLSEAEADADRDPLTPVLNRRAFLREVRRLGAFAGRYGSPASLIYFDLDGFKAVNDRFGHSAGDAALQAVAERLAAHVRESDVVGRMGGDEFAVALAQADRGTADAKAAALAGVIEGEPVVCGEWSVPLHISWGVRDIDPEVDVETLVSDADAAMYAMKRLRQA